MKTCPTCKYAYTTTEHKCPVAWEVEWKDSEESAWESFGTVYGYTSHSIAEKAGEEHDCESDNCITNGDSVWFRVCTPGSFGGRWQTFVVTAESSVTYYAETR